MMNPIRRAALRPVSVRFSFTRALSTLEGSPHIYIFNNPKAINSHLLTLLPTDPPTASLALGTTSKLPPTSTSMTENPTFSRILHSVLAEHAHGDPTVQGQAAAMASSSGAFLGPRHSGTFGGGGGGGGASTQGGMGSGGRGGWVHVSDTRHPPDYGRIAEPEDIFGSLEVDASGHFVDRTGNYQPSGTYRLVTKEGILGLAPYLRRKLVERLEEEEAKMK